MKTVNPQHQYIMEFIGVFFLVLTIENAAPKFYSNFGISVAFFTMVFIAGPISGGHLNPAVTFMCYLNDSTRDPKISKEKYIHYVCYQIAGGICATAVSYFFGGNIVTLALSNQVSEGIGFLLEASFTCILCLTAANIGLSGTNPAESGIAVMAVIFIGSVAIGPYTGGVVNPSIGISLMVGKFLFGAGTLHQLWIYILAPLAGSYFAYYLNEKYQRPNMVPDEKPAIEV